MRIGLDARTLCGRFTGDRTYWRGLIQGLAQVDPSNEYILYTREPLPSEAGLPLPARCAVRVVPANSDRLWSFSAFPAAAKADNIDVAHVQYSVSPLLSMPVVTTVHDITFRLFPELFSIKDRTLLNLTTPAAVRRACRVIAVSESTRRDILATYKGTPAARVIATPLGVDRSVYRALEQSEQESARLVLNETYGLEGPFALAVGVLQPRKNLPMLLRAFRAARRIAHLPHRLAVVGKHGWLTGEIDSALAEAQADGAVVMTGYVPDDDLPKLYACADAMFYPSLYEGFGLPPLEAMSCGCPVIASNTSSLPEVVGDAGLLLDPNRPGDWIDATARVLASPEARSAMRARGFVQAAKFDWAITAALTRDAYAACHNR